MPKDSKHPQLPARQFEFQKSQSEMAEKSELPFTDETDKPNLTQAKRVAEVIAEAHRKVEKRKKRGVVRAGGRQSSAAGKRPAKKVARKSVGSVGLAVGWADVRYSNVWRRADGRA